MSIVLKPSLGCPVHDEYPRFSATQRIVVRHPGYIDDNSNELFGFVATDGSTDTLGVQYGLVHTACAIIADNRFDGWLSRERNPTVDRGSGPCYHDLLPVGNYYFHVPPDSNTIDAFADATLSPYPVVPNFREWTFPHDRIPGAWRDAPVDEPPDANPVKQRDRCCRVTHHYESSELAHIVPVSEQEWFGMNSMDRYNPLGGKRGQEAINGDENMILLREDIHTQWDRMSFSIVPKAAADEKSVWAVHVHKPSQELHFLYHNRLLQPLINVRREFFLARFAWDVFPLVQPFLQRMVTRRLKLRSGVANVQGADCKAYCEGQGRGRSSPTRVSPKRKRALGPTSEGNLERRSFDSGISGISEKGDEDCEDSEGSIDPYGVERRSRQESLKRRLAEPDPHGCKRRRRLGLDERRGRTRSRRGNLIEERE